MEKILSSKVAKREPVSVDKSFSDIRDIFLDHYHNALIEVGHYLLENFFDGDIERVRTMIPVHGESFYQLIEMVQADSGSSPSKSWLYNSIKLLVDEHDLRDFQTYGNLPISHKIELLPVKDSNNKKILITDTYKNNYSVRQLRERKAELKKKTKDDSDSDDRVGKFGTKEWAEVNINCCTGCSNGCLYCFAKEKALRFKRISNPDEWRQMKIRDDAVLKRYKKYDGVVMFPTTHDITPENVYACLIVLENLLRVGNEVLIVSKTRMECIERLCRYLKPYKKQILFRFTIGAKDNEVLNF